MDSLAATYNVDDSSSSTGPHEITVTTSAGASDDDSEDEVPRSDGSRCARPQQHVLSLLGTDSMPLPVLMRIGWISRSVAAACTEKCVCLNV